MCICFSKFILVLLPAFLCLEAVAAPLPIEDWGISSANTAYAESNRFFMLIDEGDADNALDSNDDFLLVISNFNPRGNDSAKVRLSADVEKPLPMAASKKYMHFPAGVNIEMDVSVQVPVTKKGFTSLLVQFEASTSKADGWNITANGVTPIAFSTIDGGSEKDELGKDQPLTRGWALFQIPGHAEGYNIKISPRSKGTSERLYSIRVDAAYTNGDQPLMGKLKGVPMPEFPNNVVNFESNKLPAFLNGDWRLATSNLPGSSQALTNRDIGDNQTSQVRADVDLPQAGTLTFDYAVSAEASYDFFNFSLDDKRKISISGQQSWKKASFPVTAGKHTLTWQFIKDFSVSRGEDAAWIDNLRFIPNDVNKVKAKETRILYLTSQLKSSPKKFTSKQIISQFNRSKALVEQISYGKQTLTIAGIKNIGTFDFDVEQVKAWVQTSSIFYQLLSREGRQPHSDQCDLAVEAPRAQAYLDKMTKSDKSAWGIDIDTLDLSFIKKHFKKTPCRGLAAGDVYSLGQTLPGDVDYSKVDVIVYSPYDPELHGGGYSSRIQGTEFKIPATMAKKDANRIALVMSGAVDDGLNIYMKVDDKHLSADYLGSKDYLQTAYSRVTTHEIIHAIGIGTHDNGLNVNTSQAEASKINANPNYQPDLGYGDWFSVMGRSRYAIGLAPSSREYMGWLTKSRIHKITPSVNGHLFKIKPLASKKGMVAAKIYSAKLKGHIYLSFESDLGEYATLKAPGLKNNSKGILIRYGKDEGPMNLTTSVLLDPDNNIKNKDFSLKPGQMFQVGELTIYMDSISEGEAAFRVYFQ